MTSRNELQGKLRTALDELLAAHDALGERLSEVTMRRYVDAVSACRNAHDALVAEGYRNAAKRWPEGTGLPR